MPLLAVNGDTPFNPNGYGKSRPHKLQLGLQFQQAVGLMGSLPTQHGHAYCHSILPNIFNEARSSLTHRSLTSLTLIEKLLMEALWNLEDKLKLSTPEAILLLVCVTLSFVLVALCTVTILKRNARKNKIVHQEADTDENVTTPAEWAEPSCGWISAKRVLMGTLRWSRASKLEESIGWQRERASPLLGLEGHGLETGWQSHNSLSPVWQRPILRGEKCELPRFSGLILYDEKGRLLCDSEKESNCKETSNQEKTTVTVRTTLRDLL